jgi:zinc protease
MRLQNAFPAAPALFAFVFAVVALAVRPSFAVEVERVISPKGIEAWLVEDHTVPIIALNFSFEGGSAQDPADKAGLTRLLAATMDEGAGDLTSEDYQARLEELAVSVNFSTGKDRFFGSMRTLAQTLPEATEMLALALNAPRFDVEPVERMKTQLITRAKRNETNQDAIAGLALSKAVFGDHPYAQPTLGTPETLEGLQPDDLKAHKSKLIATDGLKIGVVGSIDAETLKSVLDTVFAELPGKADLKPIEELTPRTGDNVEAFLDVPQTTILLSLPGLKRDDPDYQAAFVMNHILGGGTFTSWMYQEVREKRGLSYGTGTSLSPYKHTGVLIGSASTKAERSNETVDVMLAQLKRMAEEGPTEPELESAKRFLTGSYALRFDSSGKIARQLVALHNAGLGIDYFDRRNSEIEAVTLDDVNRVAQRLLAGVDPTIIQVGPNNPPATD